MFDAPARSALPRIESETPGDAAAIEALVLAAFGPGRFAKTAERLREQAGIAAGFVAWDDASVVGSVRLWRVRVGETPALFLGPIAVAADYRKAGLGAALVAACVERVSTDGAGILLVGDTDYFGRFGFAPAPDVTLPGPVDRRRILWRGPAATSGPVTAIP